MPRASSSPTPPAAAAANVSSNAGHSEPSCSTPAYQQAFRPVTRSMIRTPAPVAASHAVKEGGASTSSRKSTPDACLSIQSAASRPTVTRVRTPHKVTSSAWKPLTHPAVLSEDLKRANIPTANPTAKRSRVASSQPAKDSPSKATPKISTGKKNRNEECVNQGDQLDGAVNSSPPKKLQRGKSSSDVVSKRKSTISSQGAQIATPLLIGKSQTEIGKNPASVLAKMTSASTNDVNQPVVPLLVQRLQPETADNSNVITEAIAGGTSQVNQSVAPVITEATANGTSQVNRLVAPVITAPRQHLQTDNQKKFTKVIMTTNQVSGLAGATGPSVASKLQIGNMKDSSNVLSSHAYRRALSIKQEQQQLELSIKQQEQQQQQQLQLSIEQQKQQQLELIKQQERRLELMKQKEQLKQELLLQQFKLMSSQPQLHIKGPLSALLGDDDAPAVEPLGTRCQLCKLDVAFRPQGDAGHDAAAPPVVAVLACHHVFHSSCIEAVYGLFEPSQCIACLDSATAH